MASKGHLYSLVHGSAGHNDQAMESTHMPTTGKQKSGMLFSLKKKGGDLAIPDYYMDEPRSHYLSKPDIERQIPRDLTYMQNRKKSKS
jgi:hypothetical protein